MLDVSLIESKKQLSLIKLKPQLSLIKSKKSESNPVGNICQHGTADSNDGVSIRYLMRKWASYWCGGVVLTVIVMTAETHRAVDVDIYVDKDVDVDLDVDIDVDVDVDFKRSGFHVMGP